jgi:NADPH-dependent dioxygenase
MFDPEYKKKVVNTCSGVAYTYKDYVQIPAGLTEISGPAIGDRAPDIDFEQGGTLFDRLRNAYFTLLVMPRDGAVASDIEGLRRRFPNLLTVETMPRSEALSKRYGPFDGRLILVRPDGYIGFKCRAEESHLLEETLERVLTTAGK